MHMLTSLRSLFKRELTKLQVEVEAYSSEAALWRVQGKISNSGGNLCMHLVGNLNTYIGAKLGGTGYVRDRPFEFAGRDIPRTTLIPQIQAVIQTVDHTLSLLVPEDLEKDYPEPVNNGTVSTGFFLLHLAMHLSYHLGQINYHRRLLDA
jgi:hypothetical protein